MKYTSQVLAYYFLRSLPKLGFVSAAKLVGAGAMGRNFKIPVPGLDGTVTVRGRTSDLILFFILFVKGELPPMPPGVGFIVDAGANTGFVSRCYSVRYPHARILAIEPDPANFRALVENCRSAKNIECLNAAVWSEDGKVLGMTGSDAWSMRVAPAEEGIPSVSLPALLKRKTGDGATLVKMDIEGAEKAIFEHSADWIRDVNHLHIEIHGCWSSVFNALAPFSYQASMAGEYLCFDFEAPARACGD